MSLARYQHFDDTLRTIESLPPLANTDHAGVHRRLSQAIDALPQSSLIPHDRRNVWITRTFNQCATGLARTGRRPSLHDVLVETLWHVRRASGVGGSDAGVVLLGARGQSGAFSTARSIAAQKLLIAAPQTSTEEMDRGTRAEPWLRDMLRSRLAAEPHDAELQQLRRARMPDRPWIIGTPDDLLTAGNPPAGLPRGTRRIMIDYKCPSEDEYAKLASGDLSLEYRSQLTHYETICRAGGIEIDAKALAPFDSRTFQTRLIPVEDDPALREELDAALDDFWTNRVMLGVLPPRLQEHPMEADAHSIHLTAELATLKALADDIAHRQVAVQEALELHLDDQLGTVSIGVADYRRKRDWDEPLLRSLAEQAGIPLDDHLTDTGRPDSAASVQLIRDITEHLVATDRDGLRDILQRLRHDGIPTMRQLNLETLSAAIRKTGMETAPAELISHRFSLSRRGMDSAAVSELRGDTRDIATDAQHRLRPIAAALAGPPAEEVPEQQGEPTP